MLDFDVTTRNISDGTLAVWLQFRGDILAWSVTTALAVLGIATLVAWPLIARAIRQARRGAPTAAETDATYYKRELAEVREREKQLLAELTALFSADRPIRDFDTAMFLLQDLRAFAEQFNAALMGVPIDGAERGGGPRDVLRSKIARAALVDAAGQVFAEVAASRMALEKAQARIQRAEARYEASEAARLTFDQEVERRLREIASLQGEIERLKGKIPRLDPSQSTEIMRSLDDEELRAVISSRVRRDDDD